MSITIENLFIGSDHAGYSLKNQLISFLKDNYNLNVNDVGCYSDSPVDYPNIANIVSEGVIAYNENFDHFAEKTIGILICGTGQGMSIAANRHDYIRAGIAWNDEIAKMMREHNSANVLCLPARYLSFEETKKIVHTFLTTPFTNEERHMRRIFSLDRT